MALKQHFETYQFLLKQIAECDAVIEALLTSLAEQQPPPQAALPAARRLRRPKNREPRFNLRTPLHRRTGGTDLSQSDSRGPHAALPLIAELGTDLSRWKNAQPFTAWLALAPHNQVSGGRLLSATTAPSTNRAALVLRRGAISLSRTATALGAFYRRLAARIGQAKAIIATARKLAVLVYRALSGRLIYQDPGAVRYHRIKRAREIKSFRKRATLLGLELLDRATGEVLNPVS